MEHLPKPKSKELEELIPDEESRLIYEFLYERERSGNPPTMVEVRKHIADHYGEPHAQTDRRLRDLRDKCRLSVPAVRQGNKTVYRLLDKAPTHKSGREQVGKKLRAEILTKYHSRCAMCGKNPTEDGVKLVIDHIIPNEWGGETVAENLQPLCETPCNDGKKAYYSSFDEFAEEIKQARKGADAHTRIGELLKAFKGKPVPSELIAIVAGEQNAGDYKKRLRELRYILGWDIKTSKKKSGKRTLSSYACRAFKPYPPGGARAAVTKHEAAERKKRAAH